MTVPNNPHRLLSEQKYSQEKLRTAPNFMNNFSQTNKMDDHKKQNLKLIADNHQFRGNNMVKVTENRLAFLGKANHEMLQQTASY